MSESVKNLFEEWKTARLIDATNFVSATPPDYTSYHLANALILDYFSGKRALIVGCNTGKECKYLSNLGLGAIVGIDVMDEIGTEYKADNITYIKASVESMPIEDNTFDLVFACATLEHVPDIKSAFREMVRVAAPGGFIYSAAAPLWCTRSGPHWGTSYDHVPWPHLRMDVEEIINLGKIELEKGSSNIYYNENMIRNHITDPTGIFNKRKALEYVDGCSSLPGINIITNFIDLEAQQNYDTNIVSQLQGLGFSTMDLFGITHLFQAQKTST